MAWIQCMGRLCLLRNFLEDFLHAFVDHLGILFLPSCVALGGSSKLILLWGAVGFLILLHISPCCESILLLPLAHSPTYQVQVRVLLQASRAGLIRKLSYLIVCHMLLYILYLFLYTWLSSSSCWGILWHLLWLDKRAPLDLNKTTEDGWLIGRW